MTLRDRLHEIVFEADTRAGKAFDVALLLLILASVAAICCESVEAIEVRYGGGLRALEWGFTAIFTVEYLVRLYSVRRPLAYATSFFGIIDLVAVLPAYLMLFLVDAHTLGTIRIIRLIRVFRVLKLVRFLGEAHVLRRAMRASVPKIIVFLLTVLCLVVVIGTLMHVVEGPEAGFDSIPRSMYWAIVTLTTVGYGDISPASGVGQFLAALVMLMGYAIIAVPTGIVSAELVRMPKVPVHARACPACAVEGHLDDAVFCRRCGERL